MPLYPYVAPTTPFVIAPPGWDAAWQAAKLASTVTPCWAAVIGDSVSQGGNTTDWTNNSLTGLVRTNLGQRYTRYADFIGVGDSVFAAPSYAGTPPWVFSATGAVLTSTAGYAAAIRWTGAVANPFATFITPAACTSFDIVYQQAWVSAGATWTYTIDGGANQVVTVPAAGQTIIKVSVTGLSNTVHTVRMVAQSIDNALYLYGINCYYGTTGVGYVRASMQGQQAGAWFDNTSTQPPNRYRIWQGYTNTSQNDTGFGFPSQPHLAIIELGVLDCSEMFAPSIYETAMICIIRALRRGRQNCSIVLLAASNPDGVTSDITTGLLTNPTSWPVYVRTMKDIAIAHNCAFVNIHAKWGELGSALGFQSANMHPTDAGHADMASIINGMI